MMYNFDVISWCVRHALHWSTIMHRVMVGKQAVSACCVIEQFIIFKILHKIFVIFSEPPKLLKIFKTLDDYSSVCVGSVLLLNSFFFFMFRHVYCDQTSGSQCEHYAMTHSRCSSIWLDRSFKNAAYNHQQICQTNLQTSASNSFNFA